MSFVTTRKYINDIIKEHSTLYKEHKDISLENTKSGIMNKAYHIGLNEITNLESDGDFIYDSFLGVVTFFMDGHRNTMDNYGPNIDDIHEIGLKLVNVDRYQNGLKRFVVTSISPVPQDTNDNLVRISLAFEAQFVNAAN